MELSVNCLEFFHFSKRSSEIYFEKKSGVNWFSVICQSAHCCIAFHQRKRLLWCPLLDVVSVQFSTVAQLCLTLQCCVIPLNNSAGGQLVKAELPLKYRNPATGEKRNKGKNAKIKRNPSWRIYRCTGPILENYETGRKEAEDKHVEIYDISLPCSWI